MAEEKQIKIEMSDEVAKGVYSNAAVIFHNENEFITDFIFANPQKAQVMARVITAPSHIKRLLKALQENIAQYEKKFGKIRESEGPEKNIGIKLSNN
jgi:prephenate dehydrogenase